MPSRSTATAGQVPGADDAGGRSGEDGFDRAAHCPVGLDQGAVSLDDHQGSADLLGVQGFLDGGDQFAEQGNQPGVEGGGGGPADRVELAGQFVTAGDGQAADLFDELAHAQFVGGIADSEVAGDGEGLDFVAALPDGTADRLFVEWLGFVPLAVVAAADVDDVAGGQVALEAAALDEG